MHVGIITYQTGHLKTWQILQKLRIKSFDISLFAFPFKHRPQISQAFRDRPDQLIDFDMKTYCIRNNIRWVEVDGWEKHHASKLGDPGSTESPSVFLTCIAKIIPIAFISERIIVKCSPWSFA